MSIACGARRIKPQTLNPKNMVADTSRPLLPCSSWSSRTPTLGPQAPTTPKLKFLGLSLVFRSSVCLGYRVSWNSDHSARASGRRCARLQPSTKLAVSSQPFDLWSKLLNAIKGDTRSLDHGAFVDDLSSYWYLVGKTTLLILTHEPHPSP